MKSIMNSVVSVLPVKDYSAAVAWYARLLSREADLVPVEGVAEWQIADGAWIQVCLDTERAGYTTVVVGVDDLEAQRGVCSQAGIELDETQEYPGVIRMAEVCDPDGNKISFVQDISG